MVLLVFWDPYGIFGLSELGPLGFLGPLRRFLLPKTKSARGVPKSALLGLPPNIFGTPTALLASSDQNCERGPKKCSAWPAPSSLLSQSVTLAWVLFTVCVRKHAFETWVHTSSMWVNIDKTCAVETCVHTPPCV